MKSNDGIALVATAKPVEGLRNMSDRTVSREVLDAADLVIVGSGFFGLTIAERASQEFGAKVVILEKRSHIGGNAYSYIDSESGVEVHKYGSHLFHTSNPRVWDYVNRFTSFNEYRHTVVAKHGNQFYSLPINLGTLAQIYGRPLSPEEARDLIQQEAQAEGISNPQNLEELDESMSGEYIVAVAAHTFKEGVYKTRLKIIKDSA